MTTDPAQNGSGKRKPLMLYISDQDKQKIEAIGLVLHSMGEVGMTKSDGSVNLSQVVRRMAEICSDALTTEP